MRATAACLFLLTWLGLPGPRSDGCIKGRTPCLASGGIDWTARSTSTGSLGSGTQEITLRALGEIEWEGRRVMRIAN
jgi:hypothetical protein